MSTPKRPLSNSAWATSGNGSPRSTSPGVFDGAEARAVEAEPTRLDSQLVARLRSKVSERLAKQVEAERAAGRPTSVEDQQLLARSIATEVLDEYARECIAIGGHVLDRDEEDDYALAIDDALFGLGPALSRLLEDDSVENIHANGADVVWVTRADGSKDQGPPLASSDAELVELVRTVAARMGLSERRFDTGQPTLNLQLPDGSRLFAVMGVTARPSVSIRRHRYPNLSLSDLVALGTIDDGLAAFLAPAVRARLSIIVAGGTNCGKTTALRALCHEIPPLERLVTIEDTFELGLDRHPELHPDVVAMEVRPANIEHEGAVSAADLVREGLRMAPSRVIVGEARSGDELVPMLWAMTQGNDGSMSSVHADSSDGALARLAMYATSTAERFEDRQAAKLIANAVDLIVFLSQDVQHEPSGATPTRRYVSSVREVRGAEGSDVISNEIFRPGPDGRAVPSGVPVSEVTMERLEATGYDRAWLERPGGWWRP